MNFDEREEKRNQKSVVSRMITSPEQQKKPTLKQKGTYLTPDHIMKLKMEAARTGKKDYQIMMEALDLYFQKHGIN